jgi:non-specific protein-tyrosine kinase
MKLRKALEKAKQERRERAGQPVAASPKLKALQVDWSPPVYDQSRRVALDFQVLADNRCISILNEDPAADDYEVLRTQLLQRTWADGRRTIMITSPRAGEGKTLTAVNLAVSFAKEHHKTVILVDADLKKQAVHKLLGYDSDRGLVDYLSGSLPLQELIVWPGIEKLTLISGGGTVMESAELMGSPLMKNLVDELKHRYSDRYVFFDVPPLLGGADAMAFAQHVDGIVMVIGAGKSQLPEIKRATEAIPEEKFLGFVLNRP